MNIKKEAREFLKDKHYCVISTVSKESKSESAYVAFSENEDLEIMIGTSRQSRKFRNILHNPNVSIVFWDGDKKTLQYEGVAHTLGKAEWQSKTKLHYVKQPGAAKYETDPSQTYFVVKPSWVRLVESGPKVLGEMRFDS